MGRERRRGLYTVLLIGAVSSVLLWMQRDRRDGVIVPGEAFTAKAADAPARTHPQGVEEPPARSAPELGTAPPQEARPLEAGSLLFEVQAVRGREPIPGASITVMGPEVSATLPGVTDSDGCLLASLDQDPEVYLVAMVRADGFASRLYNVGYQRAGHVIIGMAPQGTLHGTVVDLRGSPVPDAEVVAFPIAYRIDSPEGVDRIRRGLHSGAIGRTDTQGAFRLTGLATGASHVLAAGSSSGFSEIQGAVPGQQEPVVLVTKDLIGCYVEVRLQDGSPLPAVTFAESMGVGLWVGWRGSPARPLPIDYLEQPLRPPFQLGLMPEGVEGIFESCWPRVPGVFLCLGLLDQPVSEPVAVRVSGKWPSMPAFEIQAGLTTWAPGFPTQTTTLPREGYETGRLVLTLANGAGEPLSFPCDSSVDTVVLEVVLEDLGEGSSQQYGCGDLSRPIELVVPPGRYALKASPNSSTTATWPMVGGDRTVDVLPGEETHVALHATGLGSLAMDVRKDSGEVVDGELRFFLKRVDVDAGVEWVSLARRPYCLPRLPVGTYRVHRLMSFPTQTFQVVPETFRVDEGGHTRIEVVLLGE